MTNVTNKDRYDGYMGTLDYGRLGAWERVLCFIIGSFVFGVLWLMFKPVDVIARWRGSH